MDGQKRIALSAHDAMKPALAAWSFANERLLSPHALTATGNTGRVIMQATGLDVQCLRSGALGGDMELGAIIADGRIDILILWADPVTRQPHEIDPSPLLRISAVAEIVVATTETTADFVVRSDLMGRPYARRQSAPALPAVLQRLDTERTGRA
ncbi:MAG: methylglyoxal synthase [Pseudomonadota bacterium]